MKLIEPSVEIIKEEDILKKIELCGRVCYKSENRITKNSARKFCKMLLDKGHTSVFEHVRIKLNSLKEATQHNISNAVKGRINKNELFIGINLRDWINLGNKLDDALDKEQSNDYLTVRFICDRGIANQLVRHRVFSFAQESTRYCRYKDGIQVVYPKPREWATDKNDARFKNWLKHIKEAETGYLEALELGMTPEEARGILPISTKTELVMTGLYEHWIEMLKLRLSGGSQLELVYLLEQLNEKTNIL